VLNRNLVHPSYTMKIEEAGFSETLETVYKLHGVSSQKRIIFIKL
jgi:hypothetical protein